MTQFFKASVVFPALQLRRIPFGGIRERPMNYVAVTRNVLAVRRIQAPNDQILQSLRRHSLL